MSVGLADLLPALRLDLGLVRLGSASARPQNRSFAGTSDRSPLKALSSGQWNHYYVRCINGEVRLWVNGEEVSGGKDCEPSAGFLCLESEGSPVDFRNLRIRVLP